MDWINRARHLQPPIDQTEMVDQITSHFSYNIALALRGLRITTTNDLIQQLTYLQCADAPSNNNNAPSSNSNNNNTPSNSHQQNSYNNPSNSRQQNSYNNPSVQNSQIRYPSRQQNNYNRSQSNNGQSSPSNHNAPPPES